MFLTAAFSWLPAENFGTVAAGMCTFWLGFRGLTPSRAARWLVENLPHPVNVIESPCYSASVTQSSTASTAAPASRRERFAFDATASTNSCFVTCSS